MVRSELAVIAMGVVLVAHADVLCAQPTGSIAQLPDNGGLAISVGYYRISTEWETDAHVVGFSGFEHNILYVQGVYDITDAWGIYGRFGAADAYVGDFTPRGYLDLGGDRSIDYGFQPYGSIGLMGRIWGSSGSGLRFVTEASAFGGYERDKRGVVDPGGWNGTLPVDMVVKYHEIWTAAVAFVAESRVRVGEIYAGLAGYRSGARSDLKISASGQTEVEAGYGEGAHHVAAFTGFRIPLWRGWRLHLEGRVFEPGFGLLLSR